MVSILSWMVSQINFTSIFIEWYCEEMRSKLLWQRILSIHRFMVKKLTFTTSYEIYYLVIIIISKTNDLNSFKKWFQILLATNGIHYRRNKHNKTIEFSYVVFVSDLLSENENWKTFLTKSCRKWIH